MKRVILTLAVVHVAFAPGGMAHLLALIGIGMAALLTVNDVERNMWIMQVSACVLAIEVLYHLFIVVWDGPPTVAQQVATWAIIFTFVSLHLWSER